jgi:hypothetical protein
MRHWIEDRIDADLEMEGLDALEAVAPDDWEYFEEAGCWLPVVAKNREQLQQRGTFERALLRAWYATQGTTWDWQPAWIRELFVVHADRESLRAEGDPVPARPRFHVYRGVAGLGEHRRENGLAWTLDRAVAERFASYGLEVGLADPLVLEGSVLREDVLAYINWRKESEMICSQVEIVGRHGVSASVGSTAATTGLS